MKFVFLVVNFSFAVRRYLFFIVLFWSSLYFLVTMFLLCLNLVYSPLVRGIDACLFLLTLRFLLEYVIYQLMVFFHTSESTIDAFSFIFIFTLPFL